MPIESLGNNGWVATGKSVDYARLAALRGRLKLEILGIKFRGSPTSTILRREFKWPTRDRRALLAQLEAYMKSVKESWNA